MKVTIDFSELKEYIDSKFEPLAKDIQSIKETINEKPEKNYKIKEVCELLNCSRQALYNAFKKGRLKKEYVGKGIRITERSLDEYRESGHKVKRRRKKNLDDNNVVF